MRWPGRGAACRGSAPRVRAGEDRCEEFLYELKAGLRAACGRPRPADRHRVTAPRFPPVSVVRGRCIAEPPLHELTDLRLK